MHPAADPAAWPFEISAQGTELYEALPERFTFDELLAQGEALGHSAEHAVAYLRLWEAVGMVEACEVGLVEVPEKRPYF